MNKSMRYAILLLLCLCFLQPARAAELLRLFTTAPERAALDAALSKPEKPSPTATGDTPQAPPQNRPRYITFDGLIVRSQGPTTVWVNGSNQLFQPGFEVELDKMTDTMVPILLSDSKQTIRLKPGQTINTLDGTMTENFEPARFTIAPPISPQANSK